MALEREFEGNETELEKTAALIEQKRRERAAVVARYDADKARWRELQSIADANAAAARGDRRHVRIRRPSRPERGERGARSNPRHSRGLLRPSAAGAPARRPSTACDNRARFRQLRTSSPAPQAVMAQYVYTMNRVGKIVPPKRQILKDISLSFFPGRQDRRARPQRRRQVEPAAHHGRRGPRDRGRGGADAGAQDRLPEAGAGARSRQDRARSRSRRA